MPEYQSIEVYVKCDEDTLSSVIEKYRHVLEQLHCMTHDVEAWLSQIVWPSWEKGYSTDYPSVTLFSENELFPARIYLSFPIAEDEKRWAEWVKLGLLIEAMSLRAADAAGLYFENAGSFLWHLLEAFALAFPENGAYCNDEIQDGEAGYVVMTGKGNFWFVSGYDPAYPLFDAALVPLEIVDRFQPIPEIFEHITWNGFVGLAVRDRFLRMPWETSRLR